MVSYYTRVKGETVPATQKTLRANLLIYLPT
jgi:hypothetical protein